MMNKPKRKLNLTAVFIIILIILLGINTSFYNKIIETGGASFKAAYDSAKQEEEKEIYNKFYEAAFSQYRTSNDISVNIGDTNNEGKLEVLSVYDTAYIIQEGENSTEGTSAWLEVPGKGVFTVDIRACEFITDHQRNTITARIPHPELNRFTIDYKNVKLLSFSKSFGNGSVSDGEELARRQLQEGDQRIRENILSSHKIISGAEDAAEKMVTQLLVSLNPAENITISVEFIE